MTATALGDLRSRVADALDDPAATTLIPGVSVLPDVVDSLTPPAYLLVWGNPWVLPGTFCSHVVRLDVVCIAERVEPAPGVETLEMMLAVALDRLRAAGLPEATVQPPGRFDVGGIPYLAARVTIEARLTIPLPAIAPTMDGTAHLVATAVLAATGATTAPGTSTGAAALAVTATLSAVGTASPPGTSTAVAFLASTPTLTATGSVAAWPTSTGAVALATTPALTATGSTSGTSTGAAALVTTPALTATGTTLAGAWSPLSLPGLVAWYDASDAASITASGGLVSQWADKSGNANHVTQTVGASKPTTGVDTVNGRNALTFDGARGLDKIPLAVGVTNQWSLAFIIDPTTTTPGHPARAYGTASSYGFYLDGWNASQNQGYLVTDQGAFVSAQSPPPTTMDTVHLFVVTCDVANLRAYFTHDNASAGTPGTITAGQTSTITKLDVGKHSGVNVGAYNGKLCEVILCGTALLVGDANYTALRAYAQSKWGTP